MTINSQCMLSRLFFAVLTLVSIDKVDMNSVGRTITECIFYEHFHDNYSDLYRISRMFLPDK